jgi:deazaflavin-dependent oxidoreductase (nitroreductase family)
MSTDFNAWNKEIIAEFRANGGKCGGMFEGAPMVIVHNRGAKTGAERLNPLVPLLDGDRMYIIASKAGAPDNPDWYYNVKANPRVSVEYLTEAFEADAVEIEDEAERSRLYALQAARFESFAEYAKMTTRRIPVLELVRA